MSSSSQDLFRADVLLDATHTLLDEEQDPARVFRGIPLDAALQAVVYRWAFPCPVRTLGLLLAALSILSFNDIIRFAAEEVRFANLLVAKILSLCQIDLADPKYSRILLAAIRVRMHVVLITSCQYVKPSPAKRGPSTASIWFYKQIEEKKARYAASSFPPACPSVCGANFDVRGYAWYENVVSSVYLCALTSDGPSYLRNCDNGSVPFSCARWAHRCLTGLSTPHYLRLRHHDIGLVRCVCSAELNLCRHCHVP